MKHPFRDALGRRGMAAFWAALLLIVIYLALSRFNVVIVIFQHIFYYISPLIYGIIIAYILDPLIKLIERYIFGGLKRRKLARGLSILLMVIILLVLITLLVAALVPRLAASVTQLTSNLETYFETFRQQLIRWEVRFPVFNDLGLSMALGSWDGFLERLTGLIMPKNGTSPEDLVSLSVSIGRKFINAFILCFITLYLLVDKRRIMNGLTRVFQAWMSREHFRSFRRIMLHCHRILVRFIAYNLLDALVVGICTGVFCVIAHTPYPLLVAIIVGVTNLVPTFGAIVGALISMALILLVNPPAVIAFFIFIVILQVADGYFIKPMLFGETMGLASVWVLVAVVIGVRMFGIVGGLIAVPIVAILSYLLGLWIQHGLDKKGIKLAGAPSWPNPVLLHRHRRWKMNRKQDKTDAEAVNDETADDESIDDESD